MTIAVTGGAAGAAAAAAAISQAIKASGAIVRADSRNFETILNRQKEPLLVIAEGEFFKTTYKYLTSYKGLASYAETKTALNLPGTCQVIKAGKIWIPG